MKSFPKGIFAKSILVAVFALPGAASAAWFSEFSESEQLTAINSKQFNGYQRTRLADGSFAKETFAFGDGQEVRTPVVDPRNIFDDVTMRVSFIQLAHDLAGPLGSENYVTATNPATTRLLVMVYWGRTDGGNHFSGGTNVVTESVTADWQDFQNATLLGFEKEAAVIGGTEGDSVSGQLGRSLHDAIFSQLEVDRYFVILRAYDFQEAWKHHKMKLLWETRFSINERHRDFKADVTTMAMSAAPYFGQDTYGLAQEPLVREGRVDIGDVKLIDYLSSTGDRTRPVGSLSGTWRGNLKTTSKVVLRIDADGGATFQLSRRGEMPAHVYREGGYVIVTVPGWDVEFRGKLTGETIQGSLSEYRANADVTLERQK